MTFLSAEDDEVDLTSVRQPLNNVSTFTVDDLQRSGSALGLNGLDLLSSELLSVLSQVAEGLTVHLLVVGTEAGRLEHGGWEDDEEDDVVTRLDDLGEVVLECLVTFWGVFPTD